MSTTAHAPSDHPFHKFRARPAIMRHNRGLAASPPVRYRLKVEGSRYSPFPRSPGWPLRVGSSGRHPAARSWPPGRGRPPGWRSGRSTVRRSLPVFRQPAATTRAHVTDSETADKRLAVTGCGWAAGRGGGSRVRCRAAARHRPARGAAGTQSGRSYCAARRWPIWPVRHEPRDPAAAARPCVHSR